EHGLQSVVERFARLPRCNEKSFAIMQIETSVRIAPQLLEDRFVLARRLGEIDALPAQCVDGKRVEIQRVDATPAESFDERYAIAERVVFDQIAIRRDEAAQVFAERDVDGRNVVERPDANVEHMSGG